MSNWIEEAGLEKFALDTADKLHFNRRSDENPSIILSAFKKVIGLKGSHAPDTSLQAELSKAQEKIEVLEKHPLMFRCAYCDKPQPVKEQTNDKHKGE